MNLHTPLYKQRAIYSFQLVVLTSFSQLLVSQKLPLFSLKTLKLIYGDFSNKDKI